VSGRLGRVTTLGDFHAQDIEGRDVDLASYLGRVVLVVNTASQCGFTPQYAGLQRLYEDHREDGLVVLGFPCDQFGHQEPGNEQEIQRFCSSTYRVTFPLFAKLEVNGPGAHPLFQHLKAEQKGAQGKEAIQWNFTKFLVGPDGTVLKRYASADTRRRLEPS
jgi:glutathione peroxidase